jgi:hypothetical protein
MSKTLRTVSASRIAHGVALLACISLVLALPALGLGLIGLQPFKWVPALAVVAFAATGLLTLLCEAVFVGGRTLDWRFVPTAFAAAFMAVWPFAPIHSMAFLIGVGGMVGTVVGQLVSLTVFGRAPQV